MAERDAAQDSSALIVRAKGTVDGLKVGGEAASRAVDGNWDSLTGKAEVAVASFAKVDVKGTINAQGGGDVGAAATVNDVRVGPVIQSKDPGESVTVKPEVSYRKTQDFGVGAVAVGGREVVTDVRPKPKPDRDLEQAQFEATGKVPGSIPGPNGTSIPPSAQWEDANQEQLAVIRAEQAATDKALTDGFAASHAGQPTPETERLRVDRVARADGVNTEAAAYKRGGWVEQARSQGLDDAAITKLRIDSGMRSGPDGVAAQ